MNQGKKNEKIEESELLEKSNVSDQTNRTVEPSDIAVFWREEVNMLKGRSYTNADEVIRDIADSVIKRLNLPYSQGLKDHLLETLKDDEGVTLVLKKEFGF
jgi:hypothetical protein